MDIKKIAFALIVGAAAVFFVMRGAEQSAQIKADATAEAQTLLVQVEGYEANQSWYDQRSDIAIDQAFQASTTKEGYGRRSKRIFNADLFLPHYFEKLINMAQNEGKTDIVKKLIKLREDYAIPRPMDMEA